MPRACHSLRINRSEKRLPFVTGAVSIPTERNSPLTGLPPRFSKYLQTGC